MPHYDRAFSANYQVLFVVSRKDLSDVEAVEFHHFALPRRQVVDIELSALIDQRHPFPVVSTPSPQLERHVFL